MNILVTGSAGFIGFHFCKKLLKETNYKIYGLDNLNNYYSVKLKKKRIRILQKYKNFRFNKKDLKDDKTYNLFKKIKFSFIFHLAAQAGVRYSVSDPKRYIDDNVIAFSKLLDFSRSQNCKCIFYASSSSVYGDSKILPSTENMKLNPKNVYGLTKKFNEELSSFYSKNYNQRIIGLRFFTVYGPWGRPDMLILKLLDIIKNNKIFTLNNFGKHKRDFTYIDDVTHMMLKLLNNYKKTNINDIFNICSNNPINLMKIINYIFKKTKKIKIRKVSLQKVEVLKTHGSNKKILKIIKLFKLSNIYNSLDKTIQWHKKNNY